MIFIFDCVTVQTENTTKAIFLGGGCFGAGGGGGGDFPSLWGGCLSVP